MPKFAYVVGAVACPVCRRDVTFGGRVGIQWGYCSLPQHGTGPAYQVGDIVRWRRDHKGDAHPWFYFSDGSANIGDPEFADVLVRETEHDIRRCSSCGAAFAGIGVLIRDGIIRNVRAYTDGLPAAELSVYDEGQVLPRPDWDDHAMRMAHEESGTGGYGAVQN